MSRSEPNRVGAVRGGGGAPTLIGAAFRASTVAAASACIVAGLTDPLRAAPRLVIHPAVHSWTVPALIRVNLPAPSPAVAAAPTASDRPTGRSDARVPPRCRLARSRALFLSRLGGLYGP